MDRCYTGSQQLLQRQHPRHFTPLRKEIPTISGGVGSSCKLPTGRIFEFTSLVLLAALERCLMEDVSRNPRRDTGEWNPYYCPKGLRLWLSASLCAGNVQEGLLKTKLREGSVICWKDARKLVDAQDLDMDDRLHSFLGADAEDFAVRFLYLSCDSSLQPLSLSCDSSLQPLSERRQLDAIWLDGDRLAVGGECESWHFDARSWRPQCLVITNYYCSDFLFSHTEFVSGLEVLCLEDVLETPSFFDAFQHLRVLYLKRKDGATVLEFLGSLSRLETLILLDFGDLSEFPAGVRKLLNLRQLYIEKFNFKPYLPDWLGELVRLENLRLTCYELVLPSPVGALPSLRRLSLKCWKRADSLELISNLQSLENLTLRMYGGTALPLAITALTRLTTLKLLGTLNYSLPKEFNIRCCPQLKLLRLSGYLIESWDKTRLPKMEKVAWAIFEAKAPFSWAGAPQSMHPTIVNIAEPGLSLEQHSLDMRGGANTDTARMKAIDEVGSDTDAGPAQFGSAMAAHTDSLKILRPQPRYWPPPLLPYSNIGRQAALEQVQEPPPEDVLNVDSACELSPEEATHMETVDEGVSDADAEHEQIGGAMSVAADGLVLLRPQLSHRLMPPPLSTNLGRQATLEQDPEPIPEPASYVDRAFKITPEGAVHAEAVDEVRSDTDAGPRQIEPAMAVPAHSVVPFADFTQPLVAASTTPRQHEPSGTAAGGRRSTKGQELCCMKCTHMDQRPVPLKKHVCPLKDKKWEDIERETGRKSRGLKKRGRQAALEQAPEQLPEHAPYVEPARGIRSLDKDNKMVEKLRTVVSAMERLGEIPKMLEDDSKKFEPKDLQRMSVKMEDRYEALREELSGLCKLLGIDITTMLRVKD